MSDASEALDRMLSAMPDRGLEKGEIQRLRAALDAAEFRAREEARRAEAAERVIADQRQELLARHEVWTAAESALREAREVLRETKAILDELPHQFGSPDAAFMRRHTAFMEALARALSGGDAPGHTLMCSRCGTTDLTRPCLPRAPGSEAKGGQP